MSEDNDDSSKTEEPSHKKLEDARKKGQFASTRELNHFFIMLALAFFIFVLAPGVGKNTLGLLAPFITQPDQMEISGASLTYLIRRVGFGFLFILALPLLATWVAAIAPSVVQNKWTFSTESIKPKFSKLSPLSGMKRLFGMKALIEFGKNLLKVTVIGIICGMIILPYRHQLYGVAAMQKAEMLAFTQHIAGKVLIGACILMFLLSIGDYFLQRFIFLKSMRMTKQELKDEYKQQEGDPHVKQKLKAIRREKAKQRMMANVPKADVIVTNPTHYAVALRYDATTMQAPTVVAKGTDDVAGRIRDLATQNKIPIVRNPPLARVLYDTAELDETIPAEHFAAVAKIIGYVYKLKGKTLPKAGGPNGKMTLNMPGGKKK